MSQIKNKYLQQVETRSTRFNGQDSSVITPKRMEVCSKHPTIRAEGVPHQNDKHLKTITQVLQKMSKAKGGVKKPRAKKVNSRSEITDNVIQLIQQLQSLDKSVHDSVFNYVVKQKQENTTIENTAPMPRVHRIIRRKMRDGSRRRPILSGNGMYCKSCGAKETTEWRRGPDGNKSLCNACGLHYSKILKKERLIAPQTRRAVLSTIVNHTPLNPYANALRFEYPPNISVRFAPKILGPKTSVW
eukprot:CAMPEP_0168518814 /NCGR_PEP_ID=MMETSP0405-20121227/6938_1 /TAXON_ID=498012 /ORGANISM="Trichosphaerium sp, Strain Am-I-7 wt" /LENGTH=243 /DNA_ID=CAMNT_0008539221 /DNA_START=43 /DNA_END=771 /DNA_ORIENTATION=-